MRGNVRMLGSVFGFKGRIGRVRYLLSCMAVGPALVFLLVALLFAFGFHPADRTSFAKPVVLALLAVGPLWFWISLSLQACRVRDIGLDPVPTLLGWFGVNFVLRLFDGLGGVGRAAGGHHAHPLVMLQVGLSFVGMFALLLWPGRRAGDGGDSFGGEGDADPPAPPAWRAPVATLRPGASPSFGRRGLSSARTGAFPTR
jgi:uncharacterized membrane protein YhaH (DUF805 family)